MNIEPDSELAPKVEPENSGQETDWAEVGQHFWVLGESLMTAVKAAWQEEEMRQQRHRLLSGLQEVGAQVSQTVKDVSTSPEFQQIRLEVDQASQPACHNIQPHLLTALRQLKYGMERLISHLEPSDVAGEPTPRPTTEPASPVKDTLSHTDET